jgi:hypothetical protein
MTEADCRSLRQGQPVDAGSEYGLHRRRHLDRIGRPRGMIVPALADEGPCFHEGAHALLEKEGIAARALGEELFQGLEAGIIAEERVEELGGAVGMQGVEPDAGVVGLAAPAVRVLGPIIDDEGDAGEGQALHEAVEEGLRLAVHPLEILEGKEHGLDLALAQEKRLDRVERALSPLRGVEALPSRLVHGHVEEGEERRQGCLAGGVKGEEPARDLVANLPGCVAALDLKIPLEEIGDGQVRSGLSVGDEAALEHAPCGLRHGGDGFVEEPRLAHPGLPHHRHHLTPAGRGTLEGLAELIELGCPSHEAREAAPRRGLKP